MRKMDAEDVLGLVGTIVMLLAVVAMMVFSFRKCSQDDKQARECQQTCGVLVSKIINDECHCAVDTGWRKTK